MPEKLVEDTLQIPLYPLNQRVGAGHTAHTDNRDAVEAAL